jgi:uncharacterized membrane protein
MKKIVFLLPFLFCQAAGANEMMVTLNVNRLCAAIVGIPYASDNFSDAEFQKFKQCLRFVRQFDGIQ